MSRPSLFLGSLDNILRDATVTATPDPLDTYEAETVLTQRPSARVRWGSVSPNSVTLRFDLPEARRGDILVVPVWNAESARITSGAGMNETITPPAMPRHGIPRITAVDLRALELNSTLRTSNRFDLIIENNTDDVTYGGAVLLYTVEANEFVDRDFRWGFRRRLEAFGIEHKNDHGTDLVNSLRTQQRGADLFTPASEADRALLYTWFEENLGYTQPAFVWVDPDGRDVAFYGRLQKIFQMTDEFHEYVGVGVSIDEIGTGKPL